MANLFAQIPYGTNATGISINYGDTVPNGGVNLSYVAAKMPAAIDAISVDDDLADANRYPGNTLNSITRLVTLTNNQLFDPQSGLFWSAPTDNILITPVAVPFINSNGGVSNIALFYSEELRYPVSISQIPQALQSTYQTGIPIDDRYFTNEIVGQFASLISITTKSGQDLPTGYLYTVLPSRIVGNQIYLKVFTNFKGTTNQTFIVNWGSYSETLNVHPVYFQSPSSASDYVYEASPIYDNSIGISSKVFSSTGSSIATIVSGGSAGSTIQERTFPFGVGTSFPSITATSSNTPNSITVSLTTDDPYYVDGPSGFLRFDGEPTTYVTPTNTTAPTSLATAITVVLSTVTVASDNNGQAFLKVNVYGPTGALVQSWTTITSPATYSYFNPNAVAGPYTIQIIGSVDDTKGIVGQVGPGKYTYTASWAGSIGYYTPVSTTYAAIPGTTVTYQTPTNTLAPTGASVELSMVIGGITVPVDPYGTTSFTVTLTDPNGTVQNTWGGLTSPTTLTYSNGAAVAGSWIWSITANVVSNSTGTSVYITNLTGTLEWYVAVPGVLSLFSNFGGTPFLYETSAVAIAPLTSNTQMSLTLPVVTTHSDANGTSSLLVKLTDPNGKIVQQWNDITSPQVFTYSNLSAIGGEWAWSVQAVCANLGIAVSSYTDTFSGSATWYESIAATGTSSQSRILGFTFNVGGPDGTVYTTYDSGPQIFVQEPQSIDASENWYLLMHRGWLNYTDFNNNTYLVGLEPYYTQNFDTLIPIIYTSLEDVQIQDPQTILVRHTPMLVDINYPIDIVINRSGPNGVTTNWVTRQNLQQSGLYNPNVIADIDSAKGLITLNSVVLTQSDVVAVTYPYLQYYYVYQGFPDGFGRFVHLDVNPAAEHSWMNIWNVESIPASISIGDSGLVSISSVAATASMATQHTGSLLASGTAIIGASSTGSPVNLKFSGGIDQDDFSSLQTIIVPATGTITNAFSSDSIATIGASASTSAASVSANQLFSYSGSCSIDQVPVISTSASSASAGVDNISHTGFSIVPVDTYVREDSGWQDFSITVSLQSSASPLGGFRHTWVNTVGEYLNIPFQVDSLPQDTGSSIQVSFQGLAQSTNYSGTAGVNPTEYPWNQTDHLYGNPTSTYGGNMPGPEFIVQSQIFAPTQPTGNAPVFDQYPIVSLQDQTYSAYQPPANLLGTYTGEYNLLLGPTTLGVGSDSWDDDQDLGNVNWTMTGQYKISSVQLQISTSTETSTPFSMFYYTDTSTEAPTSSATQLTFTMTGVTTPYDAEGSSYYNVQLAGPNGSIQLQQSNITSPSTFTYINPNSIPGVYTWILWSATSVNSNATGSSTYACSAALTWSWYDTISNTTYLYQDPIGDSETFYTSTNTEAPNSSASQLTLSLQNVNLPSDSGGMGNPVLNIGLYDPEGSQLETWTGITAAEAATATFVYYSPNSTIEGPYSWVVNTQVQNVNPTGSLSYPCSVDTLLSWYQVQTQVNYVFIPMNGIPFVYETGSTTFAPTSTATAITLDLVSITNPSDSYGDSFLDISIEDPTGNIVSSWNNVSASGTFSYSSSAAPAGSYAISIVGAASSTNTGVSTYDIWFTAAASYYGVSQSSYFGSDNSVGVYMTPSSTVAPTSTATQLSLNVGQIITTSDSNGSSEYQVTLLSPASATLLQLAPSMQTSYFYSATGAASGSYIWIVTAESVTAGPGNIAGTYPSEITADYDWYELVNGAYYNETNGATTSIPISVTNLPPTGAGVELSLIASNVTHQYDSNGMGFWDITLQNPASAIVATWNDIANSQTFTYYTPGAATGTWTWNLTPVCTNANTGTGSYIEDINVVYSWWETDIASMQIYTDNQGIVKSYQTSAYTVAPTSSATEVSAIINSVNVPSNNFGQTSITVTLTQGGTALQTWAGITSPTTLNYWATGAASGEYTWEVQPIVVANDTGVGAYAVFWGITFQNYVTVDDENPTVNLTQKEIYLYLTVDGYPFHSVLDPQYDPDYPLLYDTNNALNGTRYAAMPTIHAF